jgi:hypothetical protein
MMEAVQTSETLVNLYQFIQGYNPGDSHLQPTRYLFQNLSKNVTTGKVPNVNTLIHNSVSDFGDRLGVIFFQNCLIIEDNTLLGANILKCKPVCKLKRQV